MIAWIAQAPDAAPVQDFATTEALAQLDAFDGIYNPPFTRDEYYKYVVAWLKESGRLTWEQRQTEEQIEGRLDDEWHARGQW